MSARKAETPVGLSVCYARLDTEHFQFEAVGATRVEAESALKGALAKHAYDYEIENNWYLNYWGDVDFRVLKTGIAYRDGEVIYER